MTVEVSWYIPGRVLYSPGSVANEDVAERNARVLEMMETAGQPPLVHCIIDHTNRYTPDELQKQPTSLRYYLNLNRDEVREKLLKHPLMGWVVSVNAFNLTLRLAGAVISQRDNYRWRSFNTLEEALNFLEKYDPTLGKLPRPVAIPEQN